MFKSKSTDVYSRVDHYMEGGEDLAEPTTGINDSKISDADPKSKL